MSRYSLVVLASLWAAGSAPAATWADSLFEELSKDFGSVPRGPTLTHPFRVVYRLTGRLRGDAPVGKWYTDLWLRTNNPSMPQVRVPLTVDIESALSVSPEAVTLGQVKVQGESERRVVVRGVKPFKITRVQGA